MYTDKIIACSDCRQEFTFTESEQSFYAERGFSEPRRCPSCRAARKAERGSAPSSGSGAGGYGGQSSGYDRGSSYGSRPPREMHDATCSSCGRATQVPFRPTSGKPVYCNDCFASRR